MPQPKVSIIIPVYNTEAYLVRCLDSACQQTEQNIEIIAIDDASSDNSWAIIQDYTARDSRIRSIRHSENKKQGAARNTGIEVAQGEWLLFLDSDDYLRLDTVEVLLNASREYPQLELIIFGGFQVFPAGQLEERGRGSASPILLSDVFKAYCMGKGPYIGHEACFKLWQRSLFEKLHFPEYMSMEDFALVPCLLANVKNKKALMLPQRLYFYQWREGSTDNFYTKQTANDFGRAFASLQEFAEHLVPERRHLLEYRALLEFHSVIERKPSQNVEFQIALMDCIPKELLAKSLWNISNKLQKTQQDYHKLQQNHQQLQQYDQQLQQDRWYRFGRLPRKRKLWAIGRVLSKKLGIYKLLRPLAKLLKRK